MDKNSNFFIWDKYSDQPYPIKDKAYKKMMRRRNMFDYIPLILANIFIFPLAVILMKLFPRSSFSVLSSSFYGMGVNLDKGSEQVELINELGVKNLLIRMPLSDINNINKYVEFAKSFLKDDEDKEILINILQDREHIENVELLKRDIQKIFESFYDITKEFQIGNAINRTKWGFFSIGEYLSFYKIIQEIKDKSLEDIILVGPSVIDFEYHYTIRALFNFFPIKFDKLSALLYVDRRGAPQSTQMGIFDTENKINFLYSLAKLSPKSSDDIYITEVNWPLSNTAPYAPTSELECVSEEEYAKYMVEYCKIAKESGKIKRVYWHQLIAPGYGLVDNREGKIRKTKAFYAFKQMIENEGAYE